LLLLSLCLVSPSYFPHLDAAATSTADVHPVLAGWGGARLKDTVQNLTAPNSAVFSGERMSNFEQILLRQQALGYNTIRASFAPYCAVRYGVNPATPQDFMGNYSATDLARAIQIARRFSFWIIVDYHGYNDIMNNTVGNCWLNFWSTLVATFEYNYTRTIWEPLNEPSPKNMPPGNVTYHAAYLSQWYQAWVNQTRALGDRHWIVIQNLCSLGCSYSDEQGRHDEWKAYPTVKDRISPGRMFISLHTYLEYPSYTGCATSSTTCSTDHDWNFTAADTAAREDYLNMVNGTINTGWPVLNTEGGTTCECPTRLMQVHGTAGYSNVSLHYIQQLMSLEFNGPLANKFSSIYWLSAPWIDDTPGAGVYGALSTGEWGSVVSAPFVCQALLSSDYNYDWTVNVFDLAAVGGTFGTHIGSPGYFDRADLNGDGKIDIRDLVSVARMLGVTCNPN